MVVTRKNNIDIYSFYTGSPEYEKTTLAISASKKAVDDRVAFAGLNRGSVNKSSNNLLSVEMPLNSNEKLSASWFCTGDFNGDTYQDLLVAVIEKEDNGKVILYCGSDNLIDYIQNMTIGGYPGYFGSACANIGDINKDGYEDFAIGAYTAGSERQGMVYIFYGGPDLDNKPDMQLTGLQDESSFGYSISGIGDLNQDGLDDIIVGAPTGGTIRSGQAFIYFGGSPMTIKPAITLDGENTDDFFGGVIVSCYNREWPKKTAFMISAYANDDSGESSGKVYAFEDTSPFSSKSVHVWKGEAAGDCFGYSLEASYNLYDDEKWYWIVGAPFNDESTNDAGKFYVLPFTLPSDIDGEKYAGIPKSLQLMQNYPNPFNPSTTILFGLPKSEIVSLKIYNIMGQLFETIYDNHHLSAGYHEVIWSGSNGQGQKISSGVYIYRLEAGGKIITKKMILIR